MIRWFWSFTLFLGKFNVQPLEMFYKKSFLKNFSTLSKKRLLHRCFPPNFTKFLRTPFVKNICERLRLNTVVMSGLILQVTTCIFWISPRNGHVKPLILRHGVTYRQNLCLFCRSYFRRCLFKLACYVPLP